MKDIIELFKAARRVSVPFLAIETPDQRDLAKRIFGAVGNGENPPPKLTYDLARGLVGVNEAGRAVMQGNDPSIGSPGGALIEVGPRLEKGSVVVMFNAQRYLDDGMVMQAICNLRDEYKASRRTLVFTGPSFKLGSELSDVMLLDEPRPNDEQLKGILSSLHKSTFPDGSLDDGIVGQAVDSARGLAAFEAETIYAMGLTKDGGLDLDDCWERKRATVNKTAGIQFVRGGPSFEDIGGLQRFKEFMRGIAWSFDCVLFIDEIEKGMAGSTSEHSGDSGVSKRIHGTMLSWLEDNGHDGMISVGLPGTGKTFAGKAIGGEFGKPTIVLDIGGLMGSLVGETERQLREALKVIDSIAGDGKVFAFATCNKESSLSPELKRRFHSGRWYFDLPDENEKPVIWHVHKKKIGIVDKDLPDDKDWTGAEIRNCVMMAHKLRCSLKEAAEYVIPLARSDPKQIETIRGAADGRWFSASYPGAYRINKAAELVRDMEF